MRFRLAPRWMTLNSISLNFQRISCDFADFGRINSYTNEDKPVLLATTLYMEARRIGALFGMLLLRAGLSTTTGLSCTSAATN